MVWCFRVHKFEIPAKTIFAFNSKIFLMYEILIRCEFFNDILNLKGSKAIEICPFQKMSYL